MAPASSAARFAFRESQEGAEKRLRNRSVPQIAAPSVRRRSAASRPGGLAPVASRALTPRLAFPSGDVEKFGLCQGKTGGDPARLQHFQLSANLWAGLDARRDQVGGLDRELGLRGFCDG